MTTVMPPPGAEPLVPEPEAGPAPASPPTASAPASPTPSQRPPASPTLIAVAAGLSAAASAWMVGGLFREFSARLVALTGVAVGTGIVVLSHRLRRGTALQWLTAPIAILVGVLLTAPDLSGGLTLTRLVSDAIHTGGLLQPPVPFDPGWKVVLVGLLALVSLGAASLGVATRRPRLGVALPLPLTMGAAIIQPDTAQLASAAVGMALTVAALSVAYGAELGRDGRVGGGFEVRRLLRTAGVAAALFAVVAGLNSFGFLFPQPNRNHTIPPQPPPVSPPLSDRVLFSYTAKAPTPLPLGVLDVYDSSDGAWLLPGYDASRLQRLEPPITIPGGAAGAGSPITVGVVMGDWSGRALPSLARLTRLQDSAGAVTLDPRTDALALADRLVTPGMRYTLVGAPTPTARQLSSAPSPPSSMADYLSAPSPPNEVVVAIGDCKRAAAQAHAGNDGFDLLQCARQKLYSNVVASGPGVPRNVTPARVAEMFHNGIEATPYEITAADALLARWVGVPSRIGYGYYGGDRQPDGSYQVHPVHGATWMEAYFSGIGWIPILGQPPRATQSTSPQAKNNVPSIATDHLQLILYIPYQRPTLQLLYESLQYIAFSVLPIVVLVVAVLMTYPWALKRLRRRRRRRWAARHGLAAQIAVAYAEMRDRARDLGAGRHSSTPVAFLDSVADDAEHAELAWLVSRALWGDLRRDLREQDVVAAQRWSRSVASRLDRAQPMLIRLLSRISRASLKAPYSTQVPNLWWTPRWLTWLRGAVRLRRRRSRRRLAAVAAATTLLTLLTGCGSAPSPRVMPGNLVPAQASGISFARQTAVEASFRSAGSDALIGDGQVYSVKAGGVTYGDLQVELFKPSITVDDINDESRSSACADSPKDCPGHEVFTGIQQDFAGHFHRLYYDNQRVYQLTLSDQTVFLWFPPHTETMVILVLLARFGAAPATALMQAVVDYQNHRPLTSVPQPAPVGGSST